MRIFISLLILIQFSTELNAQDNSDLVKPEDNKNHLYKWEFGFQIMPSFTTFSMTTWDGTKVEGKSIVGFSRSMVIGYNFRQNFATAVEVVYTTVSKKYYSNGTNNIIHINYISIPVLAYINTSRLKRVNFNLVIGPQFGINAGSSIENTSEIPSDSIQNVWQVKQGELGIAYGGGFEFALNASRKLRLDTGFRGVSGLINVADNSSAYSVTYSKVNKVSIDFYSVFIGLTFLF